MTGLRDCLVEVRSGGGSATDIYSYCITEVCQDRVREKELSYLLYPVATIPYRVSVMVTIVVVEACLEWDRGKGLCRPARWLTPLSDKGLCLALMAADGALSNRTKDAGLLNNV